MAKIITYLLPLFLLILIMSLIPQSFWATRNFEYFMGPAMIIAAPLIFLHVYLDKGFSGRGWSLK